MTSGAPVSVVAVEARNLVKRYGVVRAVDGVSFEVARGEVFGFLGANGAGKTTTLRMLCGLIAPSPGTALIDGIDIFEQPMLAKARLGYLDEEPFVHPHLTGREFLHFIADLYRMPRGAERVQRMDRLLGLFELADRDGELIGAYSHGMKQKIGLASLLIREPSVLLLDEPTNGLDPRQIIEMRGLIRSLAGRHTILMSSHILSEIEKTADRAGLLLDGKLLGVRAIAEVADLESWFLSVT